MKRQRQQLIGWGIDMPLSAAVKTSLQNASKAAVEAELARILNNWEAKRWLSEKNRYRIDTVEKIKQEMALGGLKAPAQLAQYIVASAVLHAMDGWTFLGKAISCHVHGDCDTARHLAYYAELRAAMALLASEGIGAFDKQHFVVKSKRKVDFVGSASGTHMFVWDALDHWASTPRASDTVFALVKPDGKPLVDWLNAFSATPATTGLLAKSWIETWGLDLQRLTKDRTARNLSSYRPTEFHFQGVNSLEKSVKFISELWRLAEPNPVGFATMDAHLLRQGLERKFKALQPNGRTSKQAKRAFRTQVRAMLHTIGPSTGGGFDWEGFLTRTILPEEPLIMQQAAGALKPGQKGHDLQVICRASLLLRIASGSCSDLLRAAGHVDLDKLNFWLLPLSQRLGFFKGEEFPGDRADLWADVEPSIGAIERWLENVEDIDKNAFVLNQNNGADVQILASTEIAGIWALRV